MKLPGVRTGSALAGLACWLSVAIAYWAQHHLSMPPCPWCVLQRMQLLVLGTLCLGVAATPVRLPRRMLATLATLLAASGVAAALWQHFVAAQSNSCALTLADRIISWTMLDQRFPELFEVRASCADAAVDLLGIPFEFWSLALFAAVGAWSLACVLRRR